MGRMIPLRTFKIVLLPAPLEPMMPNASPRGTLKVMSCKAQNSRGAKAPLEGPRSILAARAGMRSRRESYSSPLRNFL